MGIALMRKDLRVYRPAVVGGAAVTVAPYVVLLVAVMYDPLANGKVDALASAANAGIALTLLLAAAMGGMSFAVERRDRTAEFLAMLPLTRRHIAGVKLFTAGACIAAMFAIHLSVLAFATRFFDAMGSYFAWDNFTRQVLMSAAVILLAFGVAWLVSSVLNSAVIAACLSIGCVIVLTVTLMTALREWSTRHFAGEHLWFTQGGYALIVGVIGTLALFAGRWTYMRRIAP